MKIELPALVLALAFVSGAPLRSQITPAYAEYFTNTAASGNMYLSNFGWTGYSGASATSVSAANAYIPQNLGNPDNAKGYLALSGISSTDVAFTTTFSAIDALDSTISWSMGNSLAAVGVRILVQVGGAWYASDESFANSSTYTAATFASATTSDVRRSLAFSADAGGWRSFTLSPGSEMSLGNVLENNLPSSEITGIGFFVSLPSGAPVARLDSLAVAIPEPSAAILLGFGATAFLCRGARGCRGKR